MTCNLRFSWKNRRRCSSQPASVPADDDQNRQADEQCEPHSQAQDKRDEESDGIGQIARLMSGGSANVVPAAIGTFGPSRAGSTTTTQCLSGRPRRAEMSQVDLWSSLLDVIILLLTALVLGAICERFRQSAILGYLLAGTLLGPHALNWISNEKEMEALATRS